MEVLGRTDLQGRTALVTGGGRGIGRAICIALADAGADVAVNFIHNRTAAEDVAQQVSDRCRRSAVYQADVARWDDCDTMAAAALAEFGTIDILVNNAGIGSQSIGYPTVVDAPLEDLARLMNANFWGPVHLAKLLAPQMRDSPRGDIIMISSGASQNARPRMLGYTASKAAMEALAHTLALEERPYGTRVNVVAPGLVQTEMGMKAASQFRGTDDVESLAAESPFGFICQPVDIANAVVFLCGEGGRYITNQRIAINGGGM